MITINTLHISTDRKTLTINITTDNNSVFQTVNLWTEDTYKDSIKALDFSSKLDGNTNTENFTITSTEVGVDVFDGLYFIEFGDNANLLQISAVAELTTYKKCLLDTTLTLLSSNLDILKGEGCNNSDFNKLIYVHTILNSLQSSIISGYYGEAIDLINTLKKFCKSCPDCPNLNSILSISTLNNNIILI
jgi:hypothetical protein